MKKLTILLCVVSLLPLSASAQANFGSPFVFAGVPSGTCASNQLAVNSTNGNLYSCNSGSWIVATGTLLPDLTDSSGVSITSTVPLTLPDTAGSGVPSVKGATAATGLYLNGTIAGLVSGTGSWITVGQSNGMQPQLPSGGIIGWSTSNTIGANGSDTYIRKRLTANVALGLTDVNGVPVAQTFSTQNAITGSNLAGTQFTFAGSLGTGNALPAPVVIQAADASVASGTTAQTELPRLVIGDTKNLTTGAATTVLSIPLATLQTSGGKVVYQIDATDGTNQCTLSGDINYSGENSAGVFVVAPSAATGNNQSNSCTATKTLTATWTLTGANPALLQVTPTLTGITATRFTLIYWVMHGGMTNPTL